MQTKVLIISLIIGVAAFIVPCNSSAFSGNQEETANFYETCIVREIEKCDSKLILLINSKSKNLQDYATMEAQKAEFLNAEMETLVTEMIEKQLEPKHYKVEIFLNSRFQESNRIQKLRTNF